MKYNLGHRRLNQRRTGMILTLTSLILLAGAGCQTVTPDDESATESMESAIPSAGLPKAAVPDESPLHVRDVVPPRTKDLDGMSSLPQTKGEARPDAPPETTYPDNLIKNIADPDETVEVVLNFDAAPLTEIVPLFSELLNFSYLIDPSVKGAVTMTVESEMKAKEAWQMFEHILWLAGAYASRNPGFIHILPFEKMAQERRLLVKHDPKANVEVAFVPVRFAASSELVSNIKPFLTNGATLTDIPRLNSLLVVESPENMPKIRALIDRLDKKGEANWPHRTIQCRYVDADVVVDEMNQLLPVLGFPVSNKTPSGGRVKLTALPRLQIVVVSAAVPEVLDEVERWIDLLDKEDMAEQESLFFYNVKHSDVESLTDAVDTFFPNSATTSRQPRTTNQSTSSRATPSGGNAPSSPRRSGSADRDVDVETIFDTPVLVYADPMQNRLTIRTTQRAYAMVKALLTRLDAPPLQVLIQGVLAEITLTKSTEYGFAYALQDQLGSGDFDLLQGSDISDADGASLFEKGGLGVLFSNASTNADKLGLIRAVAGESNTRVISAPQIMASNDQEAKINVGSQVPLVTSDYSDVDTNSSTRRTFNYVDTGIIMTVTPHVTAGNEVRLEISQEVSSPAAEEINGQVPIQKSELTTQLVVPDGGTILMGGLIKTTDSDSHNGVPGLKDIPMLGTFFRNQNSSGDRREILVMITVNVVSPQTDFNHLAHRYQRALEEIRLKFNPPKSSSE